MIVEEVTGMALADAYDQRIIRPLGLADTHLPGLDDPVDPPGYTNLFGLLDRRSRLPADSVRERLCQHRLCRGGHRLDRRPLVTFLEALLGGELYSAEALALAQDWMPEDSVNRGDFGYGLGLYRGASGKDDAVLLTTPIKLTLEKAMSYITDEELVEVTPQSIRLRKRWLDPNERKKQERKREADREANVA